MIATVTLNPCRDKTLVIENFAHGGMNRIIESREDLCGKGVNVSVALAGLGEPSVCLGFNYERDAAELSSRVNGYGIESDFVVCPGRTRVNTKLLERDTGIMTEINEKGGFVSKGHFDALMAKVFEHGKKTDIMVFSGSAPQGVGEEAYAELIASARLGNPNIKIVLDAEGPLLLNGLKSKPDVIKPNMFELETAFGAKPDSHGQIVSLCGQVIEREGVKLVCVSMGADGALITDGAQGFFAPAQRVSVKGLTGAGDSLVAGICLALSHGKPLDETLRCAVAAASASVERDGTLLCQRGGFDCYFPLVGVQKI